MWLFSSLLPAGMNHLARKLQSRNKRETCSEAEYWNLKHSVFCCWIQGQNTIMRWIVSTYSCGIERRLNSTIWKYQWSKKISFWSTLRFLIRRKTLTSNLSYQEMIQIRSQLLWISYKIPLFSRGTWVKTLRMKLLTLRRTTRSFSTLKATSTFWTRTASQFLSNCAE